VHERSASERLRVCMCCVFPCGLRKICTFLLRVYVPRPSANGDFVTQVRGRRVTFEAFGKRQAGNGKLSQAVINDQRGMAPGRKPREASLAIVPSLERVEIGGVETHER